MEKLIQGLGEFQKKEFSAKPDLYQSLAQGQSPETLFITCSDSRVNPNLLTQTEPGELFILRNAGNIIPPHGAGVGGEAATIEYAIVALGVKDIIVCGHSGCGAMKALVDDPEKMAGVPEVASWLRHAATTREVVRACHGHLDLDGQAMAAIEENVKCQLDHLRTHPAVAAALARGDLSLHGWIYDLAEGCVRAYHGVNESFDTLRPGDPIPPAVYGRKDRGPRKLGPLVAASPNR